MSCVGNACSRGLEVDAVEDEVEVVAVGLDLGMMELAERVLDRQLVEVEDVGEDAAPRPASGWSRSTQTADAAVGLEPGRVDPVDRARWTRPACL